MFWNQYFVRKIEKHVLAKNSNMAAQLIRLKQKSMQAYWLTEEEHMCQGLDTSLQ